MCSQVNPSWTKEQVLARSHPNMLAATAWLNKLYTGSIDGVTLSAPLTYAGMHAVATKCRLLMTPSHVFGSPSCSQTAFVFATRARGFFILLMLMVRALSSGYYNAAHQCVCGMVHQVAP